MAWVTPHIRYDGRINPYGQPCEVCQEPATLRIRWHEHPYGRMVGSQETRYFCEKHHDAADRAVDSYKSP